MKKIVVLIVIAVFSLTGFSQQKIDTIPPSFDSVFSQLKNLNFEELFPTEELQKMKEELRLAMTEGVNMLDSLLNDEQIQEQFKQDMKEMREDMQQTFNSEEFKQAKAEMIKELEAILEELKGEE